MTKIKVSVVYHSGYGHTEKVARSVAKGSSDAGAETAIIKVNQEGKITEQEWKTLDDSHAIIFGSPTYMGSVSGPFKMFMDSTSQAWFTQKWKDKIAGGFTNSMNMSGDKLASLIQIALLAGQQSMIWVSLGVTPPQVKTNHHREEESLNRVGSYLGLMTQSENASPDVTPPSGDLKTAELYGKRIADAAAKWFKI